MEKIYKRQSKKQSPETKAKISSSLKGRIKTDYEKAAISQGMKRYWGNENNFPADKQQADIYDIMLEDE